MLGASCLYAHGVTSRVEYIFRFILGDIPGLGHRITTSMTESQNYGGLVFSCSSRPEESSAWAVPHGLLAERGVWRTAPLGLPGGRASLPFHELRPTPKSPSVSFRQRVLPDGPGTRSTTLRNRPLDRLDRYDHRLRLAHGNVSLHRPVIDLRFQRLWPLA